MGASLKLWAQTLSYGRKPCAPTGFNVDRVYLLTYHPQSMTQTPPPETIPHAIHCAIVTVSDSRTPDSDRSGQLIHQRLKVANHKIVHYQILPDEPTLIQAHLHFLSREFNPDAILLNGGTGIAPRDNTYDVIQPLLTKTLPGFGEIFRILSYQEIGSRAIASRALAGVWQNHLIFCVPGSSKAVELAMDKLILPELVHLTQQLRTF
jgi:molybdenum cofactor biosynthesis protein B